MRILISMLTATLWFMTAADLSAQEMEIFRLKNGGEAIEARPINWDFERGTLTLEKADGTTLDVAANELHSADGRLVERILHKQILAGQKSPPTGNANDRTSSSRRSSGNNRNNGVDVLHGVKWYSDGTLARQAAYGRQGIDDDKPVVWFRVLGDLTGLM